MQRVRLCAPPATCLNGQKMSRLHLNLRVISGLDLAMWLRWMASLLRRLLLFQVQIQLMAWSMMAVGGSVIAKITGLSIV